MRKIPDLYFDLLVMIGGICSIITILGLILSAGGFGVWFISSPLVALMPNQHQQMLEFARQLFSATLLFFGGCIATSLTVNFLVEFLVEAESGRACHSARLMLNQQLNQQHPAIATSHSLISELAETQRRVRDLELRLNDRIDEQIRLLNRIAELEEAVYGSAHATDFYPPIPTSDLSVTHRCRYLNEGLLRCAVHPDRIDCEGCRDYSS